MCHHTNRDSSHHVPSLSSFVYILYTSICEFCDCLIICVLSQIRRNWINSPQKQHLTSAAQAERCALHLWSRSKWKSELFPFTLAPFSYIQQDWCLLEVVWLQYVEPTVFRRFKEGCSQADPLWVVSRTNPYTRRGSGAAIHGLNSRSWRLRRSLQLLSSILQILTVHWYILEDRLLELQ